MKKKKSKPMNEFPFLILLSETKALHSHCLCASAHQPRRLDHFTSLSVSCHRYSARSKSWAVRLWSTCNEMKSAKEREKKKRKNFGLYSNKKESASERAMRSANGLLSSFNIQSTSELKSGNAWKLLLTESEEREKIDYSQEDGSC